MKNTEILFKNNAFCIIYRQKLSSRQSLQHLLMDDESVMDKSGNFTCLYSLRLLLQTGFKPTCPCRWKGHTGSHDVYLLMKLSSRMIVS